MKVIKTFLFLLVCAMFITSCTTEKETVVSYGFVCTDNLFKFVDITATYTTDNGEENAIALTPANMETFKEEGGSVETEDGSTIILSGLLEWSQSKKYDDKIDAHLTISFSKKEGIDYESYKGQIIRITKYAYLNSVYHEESKGLSASSTTEASIDVLANSKPDEFYGDALEGYIDKLVEEPIVK